MDDVTFNEPQYARATPNTKQSALTKLVLKTGLAKDEKGAQNVLLVAAVLIAILALYVAFAWGGL